MRVLISGAGVAGPAMAFWLARAGMRPVVVERTPQLRVGGHAVDIRGVAVDVIERMGLLERVRAARTELRTLSIVRKPGQATLDIDIPRAQEEHRDLELVRDDLARILYEASRDHTEYMFGDSITRIGDVASEVQVTFASGAARSFDLVVGADGQHSVTRRLVFGPEVAFAQRFGVYLAIFGLPNVLQLEDRAMLYNEPGRGCAYYTMAGNQRAKALFMVRSERPFEDVADEALQRQWLRDTFRDVGWQAPRLLAELDASSDIYCDEIAQIRMPAWSSGRVALLGDAAHGPSPLSGQGTTLALVGAYVLAEALKTHARPSLAFAAYERRMRPFVLENQRIAAAGKSFLVPGSTLAIHARNLAIRLIPLVTRLGVRIDARLQRASHAIELPSFVAS